MKAAETLAMMPLGSTFSNKGSDVVVYEPEEQYHQSLIMEREFVYAQNGH